jgi:hypothetical protein
MLRMLQISDIWVGPFKLWVNLTRFAKGAQRVEESKRWKFREK